jgi:hypothetical protein
MQKGAKFEEFRRSAIGLLDLLKRKRPGSGYRLFQEFRGVILVTLKCSELRT